MKIKALQRFAACLFLGWAFVSGLDAEVPTGFLMLGLSVAWFILSECEPDD